MMRKWAFLLVILAGSLLVACGAGQPRIALATTSIDFGDVVNGEIIVQEVRVQNTGEKELSVEAVSTSCGCTQARLEPMNIPPGGSGTLFIEFDSGAHGPALTGQLIRQVFIASNDPQQPETIVELAANILPPAVP